MTTPPFWKACLAVPKTRTADIVALFELAPPSPQAVLVSEDPFGPGATVEALYDSLPNAALLTRLMGFPVDVLPLPDQDWIRQSELGLPPVHAGRFFVYGAHDAGAVPVGVIPIRIEAGLAFGTGHHETTAMCLAALSDFARASRYCHALDLGCGTGVLAIAAAKLWRRTVTAADIDAVAVAVARENARINGVAPFVRTAVADGLEHGTIRAAAPFDLIMVNILARPLTRLAPAICAGLKPGGIVLLSGLLRDQETWVLGYYVSRGLIFKRALRKGPWSAMVLEHAQG